jgi:DtxR family Mn-dependent transcriptional regulator
MDEEADPGISTTAVGPAIQDYLKAIYKLSLGGSRVAPAVVANRLGISPAAVTKMIKRLQELNLVRYTRSQELALTSAGEKIALEMIRHHRLLETYLKEALGYSWDQLDQEAEKLEHAISEEFEERIDVLLGRPTHDPHGDPIPTKDGRIDHVRHGTLSAMEPGQMGTVRRVTDGDPAMLRYLGQVGLYPHAPVEMVGKDPFDGPLRVRISGEEHAIGRVLGDNVFVSAKNVDD